MHVIITDLPCRISGFTKKTGDYYTIVLNARLNEERRRAAYRHEVEHIEEGDFDRSCDADEIEYVRHESEENIHL